MYMYPTLRCLSLMRRRRSSNVSSAAGGSGSGSGSSMARAVATSRNRRRHRRRLRSSRPAVVAAAMAPVLLLVLLFLVVPPATRTTTTRTAPFVAAAAASTAADGGECAAGDETCSGDAPRPRDGRPYDDGDEEEEEEEEECVDRAEKCEEWASIGECVKNPKYMLVECRLSCGVCGSLSSEWKDGKMEEDEEEEEECVDEDDKCQEWTEAGECGSNPRFMLKACRNSCGSCAVNVTKDTDFGVAQRIEGTEKTLTSSIVRLSVAYMRKVRTSVEYANIREGCTNQHKDCSLWAAIGECTANPGYMEVNCGPSCQSCEQIDIRKRCPLDPDAVDALYKGDLNRMFERITADDAEEAKYGVEVVSRPRKDGDGPDFEDGPWVVTFDNFLTEEECDVLIEHGRRVGYERSEDVGALKPDGTHDGKVSDSRTSLNAWCGDDGGKDGSCKSDPIVKGVIGRMENVTGVPRTNSEDLQLLEYSVGQYYVQHHDYIEYQKERPCGVRILTFFLYLNDVEEGGGTAFPELDITVMPKKGKALLWPSVLDGDPNAKDGRTDHEALPVEKGVKYGANAWLHMRDFQTALKDNCHN